MALPRRQVTRASFFDVFAAAAVGVAFATGAMDVQHYRLDLRVDPASKSLSGTVELRAKVLSPPTPSRLSQSIPTTGF